MTESDRLLCQRAVENMICDAERLIRKGASTLGMKFKVGDGLFEMLMIYQGISAVHVMNSGMTICGIKTERVLRVGKERFGYELVLLRKGKFEDEIEQEDWNGI